MLDQKNALRLPDLKPYGQIHRAIVLKPENFAYPEPGLFESTRGCLSGICRLEVPSEAYAEADLTPGPTVTNEERRRYQRSHADRPPQVCLIRSQRHAMPAPEAVTSVTADSETIL